MLKNKLNSSYQPLWIGALALVVVPFLLQGLGLTLTSSTDVVIYAIAAMGLNLMVGYTGLTSFGHGAWFGVGAYAAALSQKYWFPDQIVLPLLFTVVFIAFAAALVGFLILRRRGVYFSLLTLALSALTFAIAYRWTDFTGGESGLGGIVRPDIGVIKLDSDLAYLGFVSVIAMLVLFVLLRVIRSPFGHTIVAIRENEQRARFQGYSTVLYKLAMFILSASVTGLAGGLLAFHHRFASAEPTSVAFSGELLAIVVIGGMRSFLGPALGALFYILFRECLSIWTENWLLWFGLAFVGFILFSPTGLVGIWQQIKRRLQPPEEVGAAMSGRKIYDGLPLPAFLRPTTQDGLVLEVKDVAISFGGIQAVQKAELNLHAGEIHALIGPNGAGKTTLVHQISGTLRPDSGAILFGGQDITRLPPQARARAGLARTFQITSTIASLSALENVALGVQAHSAHPLSLFRDAASDAALNAPAWEALEAVGLTERAHAPAGSLSHGEKRALEIAMALTLQPKLILLDEPLAGVGHEEGERLIALLNSLKGRFAMLLVEHDMSAVFALADRVTVLVYGGVIASGAPAAVRADPAVRQAYLGEEG